MSIQENQNENNQNAGNNEQLSLNDDRRVKTLSPGRLVAKRFFRNKVAVTGLVILAFMFVFSFIGGAITPYDEDQLFYTTEESQKQFAAVMNNETFRFVASEDVTFGDMEFAQFQLAQKSGKDTFQWLTSKYEIKEEGTDFYAIYTDDKLAAFVSYEIVNSVKANEKLPFAFQYAIQKAAVNGESSFEFDGETYEVSESGSVLKGEEEVAYASRYIINPLMKDVFLSRQFKDELIAHVESGENNSSFSFTDEEGNEAEYTVNYDPGKKIWNIMQSEDTYVFDTYSFPSKEHWLGTDKNGMDMLTRLMYGGRVSLYIGFIVVIIESVIGVILGGISGYFGGWIDNLIMRIVDIFYCIPSMPIIIILGAAMDAVRVDPQIRMIYLMLILGFLGWPGIARMVRGQILSLREQEFMTATEACGIRVSRRIFRHLIPNVIPQLIVIMTMSLGSTIITEATLSFLGLGVKFPFASWGNIINDVNTTYVLTNYWFIWIPAGFCLLLTVLAFNLVGDGLRDAFDPKMKR